MTKFSHYALLFALFAAGLFLSVEVWMQAVQHTSFCTTSACDVVGEYIRFGEGNLIKIGAIFFWTLWTLAFFGGRYPQAWIWALANAILFGALAFDGALLGFQFMALKQKCQLCVMVGGGLFAVLALFGWARRSFVALFLGVAVWCGGFVANSILDLGVSPPPIADTFFLTSNAPASAPGPEHVLFFSLHCDHCSKILANLAININNLPGKWHFSCTDNKEDDLHRLTHILESNATAENPFMEILRLETQDRVPPVTVSDALRRTAREARAYFKLKGYGGIPTLVVLERPGWEMVMRGETNIMEYLRVRGYLQQQLRFDEPVAPAADNATGGQAGKSGRAK